MLYSFYNRLRINILFVKISRAIGLSVTDFSLALQIFQRVYVQYFEFVVIFTESIKEAFQ